MPSSHAPSSPRRGKSTPAGLSWPEIRANAAKFARAWAGVTAERAEAQTFWNELFAVFGVSRRRLAVYEQRAQRFGKGVGRIDLFWPGTLLAEHKSAGQDLDAAFEQATDYFAGIAPEDLPRFVVASDFLRFRIYDLEDGTRSEFPLEQLAARIQDLAFIAGFTRVRLTEEPEANIRAVAKLGELHDALKANRYGLDAAGHAGHPLQAFLVRILFCLFADDTGLFSPKDAFRDLIESTREDGSNTGAELALLFQVLDTARTDRQASLAERFAPFPHVNGKLFQEALPIPVFDADMRRLLLACCDVQWAGISPAIFGAMFQKIIELDARERRRQLGAHYTSEANILKLIGPLFLDELKAELEQVRHDRAALLAFHRRLSELHFLDPACGCGNFLVITYRELRRLETQVLEAASAFGDPDLDNLKDLQQVRLAQFHGIEIEEFPAQVAQVAMWLTQHQMDLVTGRTFGTYFRHLPLEDSAHIRHGDALRLDWASVVPPAQLRYILGNPPFIGKQYQDASQRKALASVAGKLKGAGVLDFVAGWYLKAAQYLTGTKEAIANPGKSAYADIEFSGRKTKGSGTDDMFVAAGHADAAARRRVRCAFVSTNSVTQGEQVAVLWREMLSRGIRIQFAHRTFKWTNEAPGKAAVHCVIVGFGMEDIEPRRLFESVMDNADPTESHASNINPYLVDAKDVLLPNRNEPICDVPKIGIGNQPIDGGNYLFTAEDRDAFIAIEPRSEPWFRRWIGSDEFLNGWERWCLWLGDCPPGELRRMPEAVKRVEAVRAFREASKRASTNKIADTPTRFLVENVPLGPYLVIPEVSSERRKFIPIGFEEPETMASNLVKIMPDATLFHFGVMTSTMHMAWVRTVCGRLESRFRYSVGIVYNNFPWPLAADVEKRNAIELAAQGVLDARTSHPGSTLADLYDPNSMPANLARAHRELDKAVDAAYRTDGGPKAFAGDADRVAFLFKRYAALTGIL